MATEMEIASLFGAQLPAVKKQAEEKLLPARSDGTREELVQHPKWPKSNAKGNKGEGQRQGAERREQSPGIQSGRDAHTGADHGGHQASHTVGLTPRRQHQHLTPGSSFPAEHGECTVWNLPAVEAASRGGEDGGTAPHCSAKVSHLGIEDESAADHRVQGESSDSGQNGMAAVVQGSRALLAPPGLGLGQSSGQAGSGPRPVTALRCDESPGHRHERSGWHDHPTIYFIRRDRWLRTRREQ